MSWIEELYYKEQIQKQQDFYYENGYKVMTEKYHLKRGYCCNNKWIMIDLGLSFADEKFPGIDILVPKIDFIDKIKFSFEDLIYVQQIFWKKISFI